LVSIYFYIEISEVKLSISLFPLINLYNSHPLMKLQEYSMMLSCTQGLQVCISTLEIVEALNDIKLHSKKGTNIQRFLQFPGISSLSILPTLENVIYAVLQREAVQDVSWAIERVVCSTLAKGRDTILIFSSTVSAGLLHNHSFIWTKFVLKSFQETDLTNTSNDLKNKRPWESWMKWDDLVICMKIS